MKAQLEIWQNTSGVSFIKGREGTEIVFDPNEMTAEDLRALLNGLANMLSSVSATLWNKQLKIVK